MPPIAVILACLVLGLLVGIYIRRVQAISFQNRGEALLSEAAQNLFRSPDYHLLNHITLPIKGGTTQIDHILVSRFGLFVIETKHFSGWIFANPAQTHWTQTFFSRKFKFRNPIFQNQLHVRAVQDLLDFLPSEVVRSVVVFTGSAEFMTEVPAGVFDLAGFVAHVRGFNVEVMSLNRMQFCVGRLETARLSISGKTDLKHVQNLERRYGRS